MELYVQYYISIHQWPSGVWHLGLIIMFESSTTVSPLISTSSISHLALVFLHFLEFNLTHCKLGSVDSFKLSAMPSMEVLFMTQGMMVSPRHP